MEAALVLVQLLLVVVQVVALLLLVAHELELTTTRELQVQAASCTMMTRTSTTTAQSEFKVLTELPVLQLEFVLRVDPGMTNIASASHGEAQLDFKLKFSVVAPS